jgi:glycosyltransferase involved in cell wall biosynthesis
MNILLLNYEYPPLGGGAGVISRHIAEGLVKEGHRISVLTTWFEGEAPYSEQTAELPCVIRLKSRRKLAWRSNIREMWSWISASKLFLAEHLKKESYDVVFVNFALPGGAVGHWIHRHYSIPYVILSHGHDIPWFYPKQMFFYHLLTYGWILRICRSSSALFVQSGDMLRNARRFLGNSGCDKVVMIPNGADYHMFSPRIEERSKSFRILFAGRLVKQKGPILFLEAMLLLKRAGIPFEARVIGDGKMRSKMEAFVQKAGMQEQVTFTGWIEKTKMAEEYRQAHVMVAPSLNEGMSMALNEALASGLYVLTTPVSCNETLIQQGINGDIISPKQARSLADKLQTYYLEKYKTGYSVPKESTDHFVDEYYWDGIIKKYEACLLPLKGSISR